MHILFVIKSLENAAGGSERALSIIATNLASKGHTVTIVTFDKQNFKPFFNFHNKIRFIGLDLLRENTNILVSIRRIYALRKAAVNLKPNVAVGFMHSSFIILAFSLLFTKISVVGSEHTVNEYYRNRRFEKFLYLFSSFFLKFIVVIHKDIKFGFNYLLRKKMHVISNPIADKLHKQSLNKKTNLHKKIILSVGRLDQDKDHATLIHSFYMIYKKFPEWNLRIIGSGVEKNALLALIQKLNIQHRVKISPSKKNIYEEYLSADIFAFPSRVESFGMVLVEAMQYKLPVIGFKDCEGSRRLINNNLNGLLLDVNPGQSRIEILANALDELCLNQHLRIKLGKGAYHFSSSNFSNEKIVSEWLKLIKLAYAKK